MSLTRSGSSCTRGTSLSRKRCARESPVYSRTSASFRTPPPDDPVSRHPCIRHHRLTFQAARLFLEAICAQTFVTHVQRHSVSGDANYDDDEHADDHADDPLTYMKTARVLRGRTRPQQVKLANDFKGISLSSPSSAAAARGARHRARTTRGSTGLQQRRGARRPH